MVLVLKSAYIRFRALSLRTIPTIPPLTIYQLADTSRPTESWELGNPRPPARRRPKNAKKVREPSFAKGIHSFTPTRQWKIIDNAKFTQTCLVYARLCYIMLQAMDLTRVKWNHVHSRSQDHETYPKHLARHKMNDFCRNYPLSRKLYLLGFEAWLT